MYCTVLLYNNLLSSNGTQILEVTELAHFHISVVDKKGL